MAAIDAPSNSTMSLLDPLGRLERTPGRPAAVHVSRSAAAAIRRGMPWVFAGDVERVSREAECGDPAAVYHDRELVALGLYDPGSAIPVRVLSRKPVSIDSALFGQRASDAIALRAPLQHTHTNGYRLCNGPHDIFPDVVVDRYADTLSVKVYAACALPWLRTMLTPFVEAAQPSRVVVRTSRAIDATLFGRADELPHALVLGDGGRAPVEFVENGIRFEADPVAGQKTGFFLDQRENRARVEQLHGKRVLNVFSYNGGFSLYAARGGADEVVSVDISRPAIAAADANFARNADDPSIARCRHVGIAADAFETMESLARDREVFDVVVVDPPSFAKQRSEVEGALRAYARLARLATRLVRPGATLVLASCSSRVSADDFFRTTREAVGSTRLRTTEMAATRHALDHPVRFVEGEYLKCLFLRVDG